MPAPELKPRPAPPRRTTRTAGSVAARSKVVGDAVSSIAAVSELRLSGRFSVTDEHAVAEVTVRSSMPRIGLGCLVMAASGRASLRPANQSTWLYK